MFVIIQAIPIIALKKPITVNAAFILIFIYLFLFVLSIIFAGITYTIAVSWGRGAPLANTFSFDLSKVS